MKTRKILVSGIIAVFMALILTACPDSVDSSSGSTQTVAKPASSPAGGNYETAQTVTLTTSTSGAAIYYTLDGNEPSTASEQYASPITIEHTTTLKAIAVKASMNNSDVLTEHYIITPPGQVVQPAASPEGGNFATTQTVTLTTLTEGAAIYYTLDESEPTTASEQYVSPITIEHTTTIKAIAVKTDMHDSDIMTEEYIITPLGQVVQPSVNIHDGIYFENQIITLSTITEDAVIYYTLDGTEPTTSSTLYTSSININVTTTLKAFAVKEGMHDSDVLTIDYIIKVVQPAANLHSGTYYGKLTITLTSPTEDAAIYYTLNETEPTTASALYSNPINISETTVLKAYAVKASMHDSDVLIVNYTIIPAITELETLSQYLSEHTGTVQHPIYLPIQIDLGTMTSTNSGWRNLLDIIAEADEFVDLDLSACTMTGTLFNPDYYIATGKDKIVFIALPDTAISIADGNTSWYPTFQYFTALKLFRGERLTSIGGYAFYNCTNLALTSLPEGLTSIGVMAFYYCTNLALTSLPVGITSIGRYAFGACINLALTSLPAGITSIDDYAFDGCTSLALTSLPEGLTSIGIRAFGGCINLALTSLPAGITSIGNSAFNGCQNMALTSLPEELTSIGNSAFYFCRNITFTSLPEVLTTIGDSAFGHCYRLALVTCLAETPPTLGTDVFEYTQASLRIEVPASSVEAYKAATNWSAYASRIFAIE